MHQPTVSPEIEAILAGGLGLQQQWVRPNVELTLTDARKGAFEALAGPLSETATHCWKDEVPLTAHRAIDKQTRQGVRSAIKGLTLTTKAPEFDFYWTTWQRNLPRYWEPPVARVVPDLPEHQLRALRWTAALVALHVRNALEGLHADYTSDEHMPRLNQALRNCAYEVLLSQPELAWPLSIGPRFALDLAMRNLPMFVPAVAG